MRERIACYILLILASCTHNDQFIADQWRACLSSGGTPILYQKDYSMPKATGVKCQQGPTIP